MTAEQLRQKLGLLSSPPSAPLQAGQPQKSPLWPLILLGALALWFWHSLWLLPLRLLVVTFHELGHATVAILTGGSVVSIKVSADEGEIGRAHV